MLSENQIERLYKFCGQHSAREYDLQVELVDHLANAVEEKMIINPNLTFEAALTEVYKGFGVMGFAKVIQNKYEAIEKYARKEYWRLFRCWFTPPRILLTFLFASLLFFLSSYYYSAFFLLGISLAFGTFGFLSRFYLRRKFKNPVKPLIFSFPGNNLDSLWLGWWFPFLLYVIKHRLSWVLINERFEVYLFTLLFTLIIIGVFADFEAHKKMYIKARTEYPLAFSSDT